MSRWNANHYLALALLAGFAAMWVGLAFAAEPFVMKLEACEPGKPCMVRHLYTDKTTCPVDVVLDVPLVPSGTRLNCKELKK